MPELLLLVSYSKKIAVDEANKERVPELIVPLVRPMLNSGSHVGEVAC